jgi:hypothetical protein
MLTMPSIIQKLVKNLCPPRSVGKGYSSEIIGRLYQHGMSREHLNIKVLLNIHNKSGGHYLDAGHERHRCGLT